MMKKRAIKPTLLTVVALTILFSSTHAANAEDLETIFKKVNDYVAQENYTKAIEELGWARKELEKLNSQKVTKLLPDEVIGFKGGESKNSSALGMTNLERSYTNGSQTIEVSLTGGGGEGMGGLAGLARMGMMMGAGQPGSDTFRIDGRTATLDSSSGSPALTIALDSGSILKIEGTRDVPADTVKKFAESMKIADLDAYLRGSK